MPVLSDQDILMIETVYSEKYETDHQKGKGRVCVKEDEP